MDSTQSTGGQAALGTNVRPALMEIFSDLSPPNVSKTLIGQYVDALLFAWTHDSYEGAPATFVPVKEGRIKIDQTVLSRLPNQGGGRSYNT